MKKLIYLIIHCTDTPEGRIVTADDIRKWHLTPVEQGGRGWKRVGYSDMIDLEGKLINLHPYNEDEYVDVWEITNGVAGINSCARHIVYVGGTDKAHLPKDTRTEQQKLRMKKYIETVLEFHPDIKIAGHNQFSTKACPCFDVPAWLREIGISEKNIYA